MIDFDTVIWRNQDGIVSVYGEEWPLETEKRVAAAIRDMASVVALPARPRAINTPIGTIRIFKNLDQKTLTPEVKILLLSGSPIFGSESWAELLASKLLSV